MLPTRVTSRGAAAGVAALAVALATGGLWWASLPPTPVPRRVRPAAARLPVPADTNALFAVNQASSRLALNHLDRDVLARAIRARGAAAGPAAALVRANAPVAIAALREARQRPSLQATSLSADGAPHLASLVGCQAIGNIALLATLARLADPGATAALAPAADALHLGRRFMYVEGEPLIVNMVGIAQSQGVCAALIADRARLAARPASELTAFLADLNAADALEKPLGRLLAGERDVAARPWRDPAGIKELEGDEGPSLALRVQLALFASTAAADIDAWYAVTSEFYERRDFAGARAHEARLRAPLPLLQKVLHPGHALGWHYARAFVPTFGGIFMRVLDVEARYDALRVAIAAELYQRAHHKPPASLAALVPAYLPAVPADPYAPDRPLGFAGGRLWSVAWDGQDQRGEVVLKPTGAQRRLDREAGGDLVLLPPESFPSR